MVGAIQLFITLGTTAWAPNHALALWLVTALFYRHWGHACIPRLVVLLLPLLVIWTPFAVVGILPFVVLAVVRWIAQGRTLHDWQLTLPQILSALLMSYLTLRLMTLDITAITSTTSAEISPKHGFPILDYLLFSLMEFAILGLLIGRQLRDSFGIFWLAFLLLLVLPLYHFGPSNDALLRLSSPCLIVLMIAAMRLVTDRWAAPTETAPRWNSVLIALVLLTGSLTAISELWRSVTFQRSLPNYVQSLVEQQKGHEAPHYVGRLDRPDLITILRTPTAVPNAMQRRDQGLLPRSSKPR